MIECDSKAIMFQINADLLNFIFIMKKINLQKY